MTDEEFFETQVFRPESACWIWRAYIGRNGYGGWHRNGHAEGAHRMAYKLFVGPLEDGMEVHHKCFNRLCVNPAHLEAVTKTDHNDLRRSTHCKKGHPRTPENTYEFIEGPGWKRRRCKLCVQGATRKKNGWLDPDRQRGTHCPHGHEFTEENTYTYTRDGREYRYCRECNRAHARKVAARREKKTS